MDEYSNSYKLVHKFTSCWWLNPAKHQGYTKREIMYIMTPYWIMNMTMIIISSSTSKWTNACCCQSQYHDYNLHLQSAAIHGLMYTLRSAVHQNSVKKWTSILELELPWLIRERFKHQGPVNSWTLVCTRKATNLRFPNIAGTWKYNKRLKPPGNTNQTSNKISLRMCQNLKAIGSPTTLTTWDFLRLWPCYFSNNLFLFLTTMGTWISSIRNPVQPFNPFMLSGQGVLGAKPLPYVFAQIRWTCQRCQQLSII